MRAMLHQPHERKDSHKTNDRRIQRMTFEDFQKKAMAYYWEEIGRHWKGLKKEIGAEKETIKQEWEQAVRLSERLNIR